MQNNLNIFTIQLGGKMKIKNNKLFDKFFFKSLTSLSKLSLDAKYSIQLAKTIKEIKEESDIIFPIRDKIFEEYSINMETLDVSHLDKEKVEEFNNKISELLNQEFDISLVDKIPVFEIKGDITANDLLILDDILQY